MSAGTGVTLWLLASALAAQPPVALVREGASLLLRGLPDVLARPEIEEPLQSGLTTSFLFQVNARDERGGRAKAGGLVEIRYELWEDVFLVTRTGGDGRRERVELPSRAELGAWWRAADLRLGAVQGLAERETWQLHLALSVVPFSSAEQRDTQRWVSRTLDAARAADAPARPPAEGGSAPPGLAVSDVLNLLLSTSIGRGALESVEWRLTLAPPGRS